MAANSRYIQELVLNQPGELIGKVMNDWLQKNGYKQINYNGSVVFVAGDGFVTAKDYIVLGYNNGIFHIESWIKPVSKEIATNDTGLYALAAKKMVKNKIDAFLQYLASQSYVEYTVPNFSSPASDSQQTNIYSETVNIRSYDDPTQKAANGPLGIGIAVCSISVLIFLITLLTDRLFVPGWLLLLLSIMGIINSNKAIKLVGNKGKAKAALILNIIGVVLVGVMIIAGIGLMFISTL